MIFNEKYFRLDKVLSYNRPFNFINGSRSIGKTYTTQMFLLDEAIRKHKHLFCVVRNQVELNDSGFYKMWEKVIINELDKLFPNEHYLIECTRNEMNLYRQVEDEKREFIETIGYCRALTEAAKIKKISYPDVYYMYFDEYMINYIESPTARYINGWGEPDVFMSIYYTIDREEERVKCFFLGNNADFYNPYHMYPLWNISKPEKGKTTKSKLATMTDACASAELEDEREQKAYIKAMKNSSYGKYAISGEYNNQSTGIVKCALGKCIFQLSIDNSIIGLWSIQNEAYEYCLSLKNVPSMIIYCTDFSQVLNSDGLKYIPSAADQIKNIKNLITDRKVCFDSHKVKLIIEEWLK